MPDSNACKVSDVKALADRLNDHAEHIINSAARDMQNDFRLAAIVLRRMTAESEALCKEITRIAAACSDKRATADLGKLLDIMTPPAVSTEN